MKEPIRIAVYNDGYNSTTGYGRIAKELTSRLAKNPNYEVYSFNITDRTPTTMKDNVTLLPMYGNRTQPKESGYISSVVNNLSLVRPHVFIPICDAFFLTRDGLNMLQLGKNIKFMPYVPVDSFYLGKGSKEIFDKADRILVQSEFGKEQIENAGYKAHVFRHGVNTEKFSVDKIRRDTVRKKFGITDEKVFLFIGRNNKRKRIERLIRGFALFLKDNPEANFKLILHGSEFDDYINNIYEFIDEESERMNIKLAEKIIFPYNDHRLGKGVDEEKIIDLYHACDWTISMASGEGTGLLSLEGFACGKPTIYPQNSNWKEILGDGKDNIHQRGISINSGENVFVSMGCEQPLPLYTDLAKKLKYILYDLDEDTYKNMCKNAVSWIHDNGNWDKIVDELKEHINEVIRNE